MNVLVSHSLLLILSLTQLVDHYSDVVIKLRRDYKRCRKVKPLGIRMLRCQAERDGTHDIGGASGLADKNVYSNKT